MTARKKTPTANPVPGGMVDAPPAAAQSATATEAVRLRVRVKAGGPERRFRAGLAFGREPVDLEVPQAVLAALQADAWLEVEVQP